MKTGIRGCSALTRRKGQVRFCAQKAIVERNGKPYCFYHDPVRPMKYGQGYKDYTSSVNTGEQ